MFGKAIFRSLLAAAVAASAVVAQAVDIELVPVGNPGNTGELSGTGAGGYGPDAIVGAVGYNYQIGKYEVTAGQYTEFLNAKAAVADTHGLYSTNMDTANYVYGCNIKRSGSGTVLNPYAYTVAADWANRPVNVVSFWDAARFANWMNNGQGSSDTETGSYTLNGYMGYDGRTITRNAGAKWFLPSENEWYKAAYHKNDGVTGNYWDYPTGVDLPVPGRDMGESTKSGNNANYYSNGFLIGSPYYRTAVGEFELSDSPYGTFDQGGNVWEWNEAVVWEDIDYSSRGLRGGAFNGFSDDLLASSRKYFSLPTNEFSNVGFRVASVPEPGSITLLVCGAIGFLIWLRRRR